MVICLQDSTIFSKYNLNDEVKKDKIGRHVAQKEKTNAYRLLVGNPEGKIPLGMDNIKMDLRKDRVVWTGLIWLMIGTSEKSL
jgi:hypothetical protein